MGSGSIMDYGPEAHLTSDGTIVDPGPGPTFNERAEVWAKENGYIKLPSCTGKCEGTGIDPDSFVPATHLEPSQAGPCPSCNGTGINIEPLIRFAIDIAAADIGMRPTEETLRALWISIPEVVVALKRGGI